MVILIIHFYWWWILLSMDLLSYLGIHSRSWGPFVLSGILRMTLIILGVAMFPYLWGGPV